MKKIIYNFNKEEGDAITYLTDKEFAEAIFYWKDNKIYYCPRLEALLSVPKKTTTEKEYFFMLDPKAVNGKRQFYYGQDGLIEIKGSNAVKADLTPVEKEKLITEDEYAERHERVVRHNPKLKKLN